jgi:hypothetical protein
MKKMKMLERNNNSIGIVLVLISIFLLTVYGSDAILDKTDEGFLPFDDQVRGFALGIPSVILPLIAFAITWRSPSKFLSLFLLMNGMLILIGSTAFVSLLETSKAVDTTVLMDNFRSFAPVMGMGIVIIILSFWKFTKS